MEALHDLVKSGKVRYIGASSMYAWQFSKALHVAEMRGFSQFVSMQNHYNMIYREEEREMNPLCVDRKIGILPWSPLARGILTGTRQKVDGAFKGESTRAQTDAFAKILYSNETENDSAIVNRLIDLSNKKGVKPAGLALAWLLHKPQVVAPIIGVSKLDHFDDAMAALNIKLDPTEMKYLEELYHPHGIVGFS